MEVVKLPVVDDDRDSMISFLEDLLKGVRQGVYETIYVIGVEAGGRRFYTGERGKRLHRLQAVGYLETLKLDLINVQSVTDKPDGN